MTLDLTRYGCGDSRSPARHLHTMQARGADVMGVDQATSTHHFESLPDGGRITLVRNVDDSIGVARIRAHLRQLQHAFSSGNFSMPMVVHLKAIPGASPMADRRALIEYRETDVPNGDQLRMTTHDSLALHAIHDFLAFQRHEHHAGP